MDYWVIVADSSEARIYSADKINLSAHFLQLIQKLFHNESRKKNKDLISDRPGHYQTKTTARGAYSQHTELKEIEKEKFAKEIAHELERGRAINNYKHLILVIPSHFYGVLEKHVSKKTMDRVTHVIHKNYVSFSDAEIEDTLRKFCKPYMF
jgi:protein required for attachment to host cells